MHKNVSFSMLNKNKKLIIIYILIELCRCYHKCVNGYCIGAPDYTCKCDLGWTGPDCAINCGCNNHSTCNDRPGICDQCQDWTTGQFCEYCK